jgi:hypothetical protein
VLEVAQMAVINRGTCAAGRTGDKVKQVERIALRGALFPPA